MTDETNSSLENDYVVEASKQADAVFELVEICAQSLVFVAFIVGFIFRFSTVSGQSMMNTLHHGDHMLIWQYNYKPSAGDIITIRKNGDLDETIVKRVIATEGESFHLDAPAGKVYVNGKQLDEPYIKEHMREMFYEHGNTDLPAVVPEGCCIALGDNRNHSSDSRDKSIGVIKNKNIIGKAEFITFPFYRMRKLESIRQYVNG
jgi:signal peptidase I